MFWTFFDVPSPLIALELQRRHFACHTDTHELPNMVPKQPQASLFQVYLRLRPPYSQNCSESDRFLNVEPPDISQDAADIVSPGSTHITLQPPNDTRKRAVERFGFTKVFEEAASQLDVFHDTGMEPMIRGVLKENRDGLVATLGVTGSGKVWSQIPPCCNS